MMIRMTEKAADGRISMEDYRLIRTFWKGRGEPPPRELLPTLGVICSGMACGFLYLDATGSGVAVMAWTATDPESPFWLRGNALSRVIGFLEEEARALGYHALMCSHQHPSFIRYFKRRGYATGDAGLVHLFKSLA